jgi:hypothetical protein
MADGLTTIVEAIGDLLIRFIPGGSRRRGQAEPKPSELPGSNMSADEIEAARIREQQRRNRTS